MGKTKTTKQVKETRSGLYGRILGLEVNIMVHDELFLLWSVQDPKYTKKKHDEIKARKIAELEKLKKRYVKKFGAFPEPYGA